MRRFAPLAVATIICLLGGMPPSALPVPAAAPDLITAPRTGPLPWGLYEILWSASRFETALDRNAEVLGGRPRYVLFFRDLVRPFPAAVCREIRRRGAIPVISIELVEWGGARQDCLTAIAAGRYDDDFRRFARDARRAAGPILYRFGFEMNGDWFAWGARPEAFIAAWRHAHRIFAAEGADNVRWVWAPNAVSGPDVPDNGLEKYWPGDAYVDVIGLDGYNFGDDHSQWHRWTSCRDIFGAALDKIAASGVPQPVLITEFGCADSGDPAQRARWIEDAHEYFTARPEIIGAIWFNYDKRREGEPNWRLDADSRSVAAWRRTFARP